METPTSNMGIISALQTLLRRKKLIVCNTLAAGVVFAMLILCVPRYYTCKVILAPEFDNGASLGSFASIASSFGINLGSSTSSDALSPSLYPDLISSKDFLVGLFDVKVTTNDGTVSTDYYTYLAKHRKAPWWTKAINKTKKAVKNIFTTNDDPNKNKRAANPTPFKLSEKDFAMTEAINSNIDCDVDGTTGVITLTITDQDPLVCASMADSVRQHLQNFITHYRTGKARNDMEYYLKLTNKAKADYDKAIDAYSSYTDSHRDAILQSHISQRDELENDMQMKMNVYTAMQQQYESAKAKVQERTPAFTTLQCASVPIRPTGPKRMFSVLVVMFLTFVATSFYILKGKDILQRLHYSKPDSPTDTSSQEKEETSELYNIQQES